MVLDLVARYLLFIIRVKCIIIIIIIKEDVNPVGGQRWSVVGGEINRSTGGRFGQPHFSFPISSAVERECFIFISRYTD